jgi:hypothetical protein
MRSLHTLCFSLSSSAFLRRSIRPFKWNVPLEFWESQINGSGIGKVERCSAQCLSRFNMVHDLQKEQMNVGMVEPNSFCEPWVLLVQTEDRVVS